MTPFHPYSPPTHTGTQCPLLLFSSKIQMAAASRKLVAVALLAATGLVQAGERNHKYTEGDEVTLWVNKVGPYHNPHETYEYYDLPFCKPVGGVETRRRSNSLGEQLEGHELMNSGYKLSFGQDVPSTKVCSMKLGKADAKAFEGAVDNHYWYQLYLDDLPIWGMVGEVEEESGKKSIYTHRKLNLGFNGPHVIEVNMTSENLVPIEEEGNLDFTYEVVWTPTETLFKDRFDRYLDVDFFGHQIHWFSIFNSTMMVVFLCGLVSLILFRTLRNDFARYAKEEGGVGGHGHIGGEMEHHGITEDSGWKQVHGDVFRAPLHLMLFSAFYGVGWQLLVLIVLVVGFAIAGPIHGDVYEERGELATTFIVAYALTCAVAGYTSGSYYSQFFPTPRAEQASQWQKTMLLTVLLFPTLVVSVVFCLNLIAEYYDTTHALHLSTIFKVRFCSPSLPSSFPPSLLVCGRSDRVAVSDFGGVGGVLLEFDCGVL